jgi:hypothetical protein
MSSRAWLALLYLGALSGLIVWEYHERLDAFSKECTFQDEHRGNLYSRPYEQFLAWASPASTGHVALVAIPMDAREIQVNVCLGRAYLADVLRAVAKQHPAVVVVDKFFHANTCSRSPASTNELIGAVRDVSAPVVVGESTKGIDETVAGSCLVRDEQLRFDSPNVTHGLTRLQTEPERFPLVWPVLEEKPEEHAAAPVVTYLDTLALAAAKAYDPGFVEQRSVRELVAMRDRAYARLDMTLPRTTTIDVLCADGDEAVRNRWDLACKPAAATPRMLGKVVVIGAESPTDEKTVLGRKLWGFELQATYIESLLSGNYLRSLPVWVSVALFIAFVFVIEGLPTILMAYRPQWKRRFLLRYAYPRRRYVWVVFWVVTLLALSTVLSLAFRFLPPLLVFGDILFLAVTRLMYFSAESAEHPLVHVHAHGHTHGPSTQSKEHPMSDKTIDPMASNSGNNALNPLSSKLGLRPKPAIVAVKPGSEGGTEG